MENMYVLIMAVFGFCAGLTIANFVRFRKKGEHTAAAGQLLMAIVFLIVVIWAACQRWM